jgi:hypothetical protein
MYLTPTDMMWFTVSLLSYTVVVNRIAERRTSLDSVSISDSSAPTDPELGEEALAWGKKE